MRERTRQDDLHLGRDVRGDMTLEAAQDERGDLAPDLAERDGGVAEHEALESGALAEQSGHQEAEDRPQVRGSVLEGRARDRDPVVGLEREARLRGLRLGVLDGLGFVEHRVAETGLREQFGMTTQLRVAGDPETGAGILDEIILGREDGRPGAEFRVETLDLAEPHRDDARRTDDEGTLADGTRREQGEHLDGLAEAHLVGQQRMGAQFAKPAEPGDAFGLVRTQVRRQVVRRSRLVEQLVLPGLEVVVELEGADGRMVEQRQQQVTRDFAVLRPPVLGEVGDGGVVGDDALAGQDDGASAGLEQEFLLIGEQAVPAGLEAPVQLEGLAVGRRLRFGIDGDLQLLVAEDVQGGLADQLETLAPIGQVLAYEALDTADIVDRPGSGGLAVGEAGPVGHGIEPEQGLPLLVGKFVARDGAGAEAVPGMTAAAGPGGGNLQTVRGEIEAHLQLQRGAGVGVLAFGLLRRLGRGGHGGLIDRRELIGEQFLDLIKRSHGERRAILLFRQRGPPVHLAVDDLDDRADGLLLGPGDGFGALRLEFDLSDQSFGIESASFGEVGGLEDVFPVFRQGREPPLQGFRGVGAVGRTRGRHRRSKIRPRRVWSYNPQ